MVGRRLFGLRESNEQKSTIVISEAARSKRSVCCPCPWYCCLLLLLPLLLFTASVIKEKSEGPLESQVLKHSSSVFSWTGDCLAAIAHFFAAFLLSIRDGFLLLISKSNDDSLPLNPPLSGKTVGIDKSLYESLVKSIRDHSARLVAQEKELKAQKAMLESLVGSHKTSEKTTTNLAVQINKWEGDLKSLRSQLSSLDASLAELKKLKLSTKDSTASVAGSGVDSKEFALLSKKVEAIAAEQAKQKGLVEELKKLQVLIVKLEGHVKEQKEWTTLELKKHEGEFKKLVISFEALSSEKAKPSSSSKSQVSDSSAALKALSDKVMTDHERLAGFETQQKSLQALLAELEKRLGSHAATVLTKDSSTDKSFANIATKLQSLEAGQKSLSERLDLQKKQQAVAKVETVKIEGGCTGGGKACTSIAVVQQMIDRALAIFAADRIARPDFALESAGGSIIGTRCTQTYTDRPAVFSLFGIPLFRMSRSPRTVIQPALYPGECWAFSGAKGQLVVRLASDLQVSGVTLEHVPKSLSPNGRIDSAPRQFVIKGLASESDYTGVQLGEFEFLDNDHPLQTFELPPPHKVFRYIELQILSNHGHTEYTCVYRLRVHGKILGGTESDSEVR